MAIVRWDPARELASVGSPFENQILTIRGERTVDENIRRDRYQRIERAYGPFSRAFTIPSTIDAARITASYKDGVLTVRLRQREEAKAKQIEVTD